MSIVRCLGAIALTSAALLALATSHAAAAELTGDTRLLRVMPFSASPGLAKTSPVPALVSRGLYQYLAAMLEAEGNIYKVASGGKVAAGARYFTVEGDVAQVGGDSEAGVFICTARLFQEVKPRKLLGIVSGIAQSRADLTDNFRRDPEVSPSGLVGDLGNVVDGFLRGFLSPEGWTSFTAISAYADGQLTGLTLGAKKGEDGKTTVTLTPPVDGIAHVLAVRADKAGKLKVHALGPKLELIKGQQTKAVFDPGETTDEKVKDSLYVLVHHSPVDVWRTAKSGGGSAAVRAVSAVRLVSALRSPLAEDAQILDFVSSVYGDTPSAWTIFQVEGSAASPAFTMASAFDSLGHADTKVKFVVESDSAPLRVGDHLHFSLQTEQAGFLVVLYRDVDGTVHQLYPGKSAEPASVVAGKTYRIPEADDRVYFSEKPGKIEVKALLFASAADLKLFLRSVAAEHSAQPSFADQISTASTSMEVVAAAEEAKRDAAP